MSATVNKLVYGDLTFTDDEIQDGEVYDAVALLSDALEIGTINVGLYIRDEETGAALTAFRRNEKLLYYYRDKLRGTYYIESIQRTGKYTYEISANNAVALLEQSNHLGGIYTGQTVDELVAEICTIPYIIQSKFAGIKLYGWLPVATRRANLAQVLFAIGAHAKTDQNGVLRIESLWDGVSSSIPPDRIFWGDKVTYESKVTEVSVLEHQYIKGTEEVTLFEGVAEEGDIIQFEEPAYGLEASGFSVQSSGANYAVLSAGTGTLTGKKYVHMTRDVRVPVSEDEVSNVVEVKEATLVSLTNSAAVAQRLAGYYQYIEALDQEVVYDGERPGDVVAFEHPYGGESKGCIKDTAITMGGRLVASEQAVIGYVPPKFETEEVLDERVVLTGSGDYTVPEGVYTLTVVCIQAGTGAQAGFDGEPGGGTQLIVTTKEQDAGGSWSDTQADGGEGGQKGAPGAGGKVYRATIDVVPGQVIHYECGTPGVGGATNGAVGAAGGETTFGDLSSAQGASSEIVYVDPVTEEELAKPGTVADRHPAAEGIMERTARMCPRTLAARVGLRMDGSLTIIHLKMYASMVVEQAVEPPMGKTENPAATVRRRLAEQGRPLMYPKRRTKLELEEMAGTAVAVAVGPEDCLHLRRLMARQNYRPVSGSRRTADRRGKGLLVQMAGRAV